MRRASLALAASTLLVLAACSDDSSIAPPLDEAVSTHPQLAPPTARSNGLPVLRNARRLRDLRKQLDKVLFNVEFRYIVPPSASVEAAFNQARRRWQKIIFKDVEPIEGLLPQGLCFGGLPDFEGTVDDVLIDVLLIPIDGPGQILGAAGPCFVRTSDDLTVTGVMIFDTDDLAFLEELELMDEVIVHEMGHVLGVGTLWDFNRTLLVGAGTGSPTYTGRLATAAYRVLGGRDDRRAARHPRLRPISVRAGSPAPVRLDRLVDEPRAHPPHRRGGDAAGPLPPPRPAQGVAAAAARDSRYRRSGADSVSRAASR